MLLRILPFELAGYLHAFLYSIRVALNFSWFVPLLMAIRVYTYSVFDKVTDKASFRVLIPCGFRLCTNLVGSDAYRSIRSLIFLNVTVSNGFGTILRLVRCDNPLE